uniref:Transglutaminase-like domain-containing protein n=1 Tax=Romanomermis culicivorax TaxID=13658 RepID=A0A915KAQ7_ROMCU
MVIFVEKVKVLKIVKRGRKNAGLMISNNKRPRQQRRKSRTRAAIAKRKEYSIFLLLIMINPLDVPVVFSQRPASLPSTVYDSRTSMVSTPTSPMARVVDEHKGMSLWGKFFRSMSRLPVASTNEVDHKTENPVEQQHDENVAKTRILNYPTPVYPIDSIYYPIELKLVDLNLALNSPKHRTDRYQNNGKLILRRGQYFDIDLTFYRSYEPERDCLKLVFEIGSQPSIPDHTRIVLSVENVQENKSNTDWRAEILEFSGVRVELRVHVSPHAILGAWNLKVVASLLKSDLSDAESNDETDACPLPNALLDSQSLIRSIYILYNPWCEDDSVYMENENERDFYVLKDVGTIWRGCFNSPSPHCWAYGQFEEGILDASLAVLERSRLPLSQRSSSTHVAKTIAEMINSVNDTGIIVGNWTQSFDPGVTPTDWTGSSRILLQYAQTGQPVCFGHCYTFAGLVTTILRCFGMPCRVVTNYGSAHDSANMVSELSYLE